MCHQPAIKHTEKCTYPNGDQEAQQNRKVGLCEELTGNQRRTKHYRANREIDTAGGDRKGYAQRKKAKEVGIVQCAENSGIAQEGWRHDRKRDIHQNQYTQEDNSVETAFPNQRIVL